MGEEDKLTLGVFYYQDAKGDWHQLGEAKTIDPTAFTIEDLWQSVAEAGNPPRSEYYIVTLEEVPFGQWPVQIGYYSSVEMVIDDDGLEKVGGTWYDMNGHEAKVTAWLPLPKQYREEGDE